MKRIKLLAVVAVLLLSFLLSITAYAVADEAVGDDTAAGVTVIPEDAVKFGNNYYKIYKESCYWDVAKASCEEKGGHLATITSQEEQDFIDELNKNSYRLWAGGYRDDLHNWYWVTGETWEYTNWKTGEPNNSSNVISNENRVVLWPSKWNDLNNNNTQEQSGYVCEWEAKGLDDVNLPAKILALTPANDSKDVAYSAADQLAFRITYERKLSTKKESDGKAYADLDFSKEPFRIYRSSDDLLVYELTPADLSSLNSTYSQDATLSGDRFTMVVVPTDYHMLFEEGTEYYITIGEGFVRMADGTVSPAINKYEWSFTTKAKVVINILDVLRLAKYVAGWDDVIITDHATDFNGDGNVNIMDVIRLAKYVAGWDATISQ